MKRLFLCPLLLALCSPPVSAILNTNNNGLSDIWERIYNNGDLFPSSFDPLDDDDSDGWTNAEEAVAGTDPNSSESPDGMVRPEVAIIHDVSLDLDHDGIAESYVEVATITWPIIAGKQYTLLHSPDMTEGSWTQVQQAPATADGTRTSYFPVTASVEKMFWRVKIEDVDSDSDGLTDAEEYKLGTDPLNAQTLDGISDLWLARYFTNTLLADGLNTIDPNAYANTDGYTIVQEAYLNLDPNTPHTPPTGPIGQQCIVNSDFSEPTIGTGARANASWKAWDYWPGVPGWQPMVGTNIEFQIIEPLATGNPYCELKAEPAGNHGIRQTIGTVTGKTYLLVMDCKARADTGPADSVLAESAFDIRVGAGCGPDVIFTTIKTVTFANTEWTTAAATFKATSPITTIGLMPGSLVKPTYGCLVDNVKLLPVEIEPDENMSGHVGDVIKSVNTASIIKHFVSPKKTTELAQDYVVLEATGVTAEQITPAHANQIVEWDGGEAVPNEPLKRRVKRDTSAKSEVRIKLKQGGAVASEMYVWIVWSDVTTTKGVANFRNAVDGAYYEISTRPDEAWRFVFKIQPTSILDTTTLDRPRLSRANSKPPPGAGNPYTIRPSEVADSATRQWDVSRQYKVTIRNPGGIPKADLEWGHHVPAAWTANQPSAADTPVTYPSSDVEGNDDPLDCIDEDAEPYAPSQLLNLNHQTGELSSTDASNTHVQDNWGAANRTYAAEINFIEFARLEIWDGERAAGQFWFRISNQIEWHHYLDATFDSVTSKWKNAASSSGTGHPKP